MHWDWSIVCVALVCVALAAVPLSSTSILLSWPSRAWISSCSTRTPMQRPQRVRRALKALGAVHRVRGSDLLLDPEHRLLPAPQRHGRAVVRLAPGEPKTLERDEHDRHLERARNAVFSVSGVRAPSTEGTGICAS